MSALAASPSSHPEEVAAAPVVCPSDGALATAHVHPRRQQRHVPACRAPNESRVRRQAPQDSGWSGRHPAGERRQEAQFDYPAGPRTVHVSATGGVAAAVAAREAGRPPPGALPAYRSGQRHPARSGRRRGARLGKLALARELLQPLAHAARGSGRRLRHRALAGVGRQRRPDGDLLFRRRHGDPARGVRGRAVGVAASGASSRRCARRHARPGRALHRLRRRAGAPLGLGSSDGDRHRLCGRHPDAPRQASSAGAAGALARAGGDRRPRRHRGHCRVLLLGHRALWASRRDGRASLACSRCSALAYGQSSPTSLPSLVAWAGIYAAGIHPTIAGVIVGLLTPVRAWLGPDGFISGIRNELAALERAPTSTPRRTPSTRPSITSTWHVAKRYRRPTA